MIGVSVCVALHLSHHRALFESHEGEVVLPSRYANWNCKHSLDVVNQHGRSMEASIVVSSPSTG